MIIYSEITNKQYSSVEECLAAEEAYRVKKEAEEYAAREAEERRKRQALEREKKEQKAEELIELITDAWCQYLKIAQSLGVDVTDLEVIGEVLSEVLIHGYDSLEESPRS